MNFGEKNSNIKDWILAAETNTGETVEAIVVGSHDYNNESKLRCEGSILSRDAGLKVLDEDFYSGYGGADCRPMYAWTKNFIFSIQEYDGATNLQTLPRNPASCDPEFS